MGRLVQMTAMPRHRRVLNGAFAQVQGYTNVDGGVGLVLGLTHQVILRVNPARPIDNLVLAAPDTVLPTVPPVPPPLLVPPVPAVPAIPAVPPPLPVPPVPAAQVGGGPAPAPGVRTRQTILAGLASKRVGAKQVRFISGGRGMWSSPCIWNTSPS